MKKRILTGDTPTGKLHLGHYVGTLENRVRLQDEYDTFIVLADLHALTTLAKTPAEVAAYTLEVLLDNLAVGLDPAKTTFFAESLVPEIYELAAIFSMYVTHNRALRNPTIKEEIKLKELGDRFSLGFINYPIYQAADILAVAGELVPVGVDQLAHVEQAREIARDLNSLCHREVLAVSEPLVGRVGRLCGLDGKAKMSKSLGNCIYLSDDADTVKSKVNKMYTDPTRLRATDSGHIEGNVVFTYLDVFGRDKEEVEALKKDYIAGRLGDVAAKEKLTKILNEFLDPIRERRRYYEGRPEEVLEILKTGTSHARGIAAETLEKVKEAMGISYFKG